jgi:hypothetical protein
MARTGKIARLPEAIRIELNQRLLDGQLGPEILPWLNTHPELDLKTPINAANLSSWRLGAYQAWLNGKSEKTLESFSASLSNFLSILNNEDRTAILTIVAHSIADHIIKNDQLLRNKLQRKLDKNKGNQLLAMMAIRNELQKI